MAENPLLPDDQLRALLLLTKECARLDAGVARSLATVRTNGRGANRNSPWPSREALLAGTLLHLQPGDTLLPEPADTVPLRLTPQGAAGEAARAPLPDFLEKELRGQTPRLLLGAAMAAALRGTGSDRLVMVHLSPGRPEASWQAALRWAQDARLPLLVVVGDTRGNGAFQPAQRAVEGAPDWDAVQRAASRLQLPVLAVDGEDAVAVYRVAQESVLRARSGAGPAVLWAMLPSPRDVAAGRSSTAKPVARLQRYLRARGVATVTP